jgi:RNA polymerase sigma factor (TIGR02999 family)
MTQERPDQTLQPTALVHEAYLRLVGAEDSPQFSGRGHFFAAAAEAMRRILVERARRVRRVRHGGDRRRVPLDELDSVQLDMEASDGGESAEQLLALDAALARLDAEDPEGAAVVKLRYFTGLGVEETAAALNLSTRTVKRHWAYAKAWLYQQLSRPRDDGL